MIHDFISPAARFAKECRVALLVDGENIPQSCADEILQTAGRIGVPSFRRVYGNVQLLKDWAADHRFAAVHTGNVPSKNCADISIVIDAMDIAHSGKADAFLIASSDGDFAPLAMRLHEGGFRVIGLGREGASRRFREMCSEFVALPGTSQPPTTKQVTPAVSPSPIPVKRAQPPKLGRIDRAIHEVCREHGETTTSRVLLTELSNRMPQEMKVTRKETGRATWRSYLESKPELYVVDGSGKDIAVRLKGP